MKNWEYQELIDAIYETYAEFQKAGKGSKEAYIRTGDEFLRSGELEDVIVFLVLGEIMLEIGEGIFNYIEAIRENFNVFDFNMAKDELSSEDFNDFKQRSDDVLKGLNSIKVDFSTSVV